MPERYLCTQCSEIHERVCARIAADRIAALEAELAEAAQSIMDLQAELAEAIEQRDIARAEWQGADGKAEAMQAERNAAIAREQAALADAAALWSFVQWVRMRDWTLNDLDRRATELHDAGPKEVGRALAARVPLWRELESLCAGTVTRDDVQDIIERLAALDAKDPK
jgi:FtsZ-binding cell division protein ZapB